MNKASASNRPKTKPAVEESIESLILLCRALISKSDHTADSIAKLLQISRDQFNSFLNHKKLSPTVKTRYEDVARALYSEFTKIKFFNGPTRNLLAYVYEELPDISIEGISTQEGSSIVKTDEVRTQKSPYLDNVEAREAKLPSLFGLNVLVRLANDFIPVEGESELQERGWSLSIMNIIPEYIQTGRHHPLFKIRQYGTSGADDIEIEGQIISQDDRFLFSGVEVLQKRPVILTFSYSNEQIRNYSNPDKLDPRGDSCSLSGLQFGVSNSKKQFASHAKLFQIRNAVLKEEDLEIVKAQDAFLKQYKEARQLAGIMNATTLIERLKQLDVVLSNDTLAKWKEDASKQSVFTPI